MAQAKTSYTVLHKFSFEAAHQLPGHPTCNVIHGHGYQGQISVSSSRLTKEGFVLDFGDLKTIIARYDHADVITQTAEQLAEEIGRSTLKKISGQNNGSSIIEIRVTLWETSNACAEWVWRVQD